MGEAMLSKSLIQFSVDWWSCVPSLLFTWSRRRQWHPTPVLLPGESHGQRSLVRCGPWCRWESDTTERLYFDFSLSCIGEGNGNPLVFLPGESQGQGSLVGCRLLGRTELDTTDVTEQTMVEVVKMMVTSFKRFHACTATLSAPNPAAGHH